MDTDFVEEIVSIHPDNQTLNFDQTDHILCSNDIDVSNVKAEFYSTVDIDDAISSEHCLVQPIESSYFIDGGTSNHDLNHMTRAVMESVPYADGLQYLAAISSFSDNFKVAEYYSKVSNSM